MADHFNTAPASAPSSTSTPARGSSPSSTLGSHLAEPMGLSKDSTVTSQNLLAQFLFAQMGNGGESVRASEGRRPMARAATASLGEILRSAAQTELLRMQNLQEQQQRRRSTSAALQLGPALRSSGGPSSSSFSFPNPSNTIPTHQRPTVTSAVSAAAAASSHKRQWEETTSSHGFLEQAGAVAQQFGEFFTQERAWAGMALAAAARRDSEHSSGVGPGMSRTGTDRSSISTMGSRASLGWAPAPHLGVARSEAGEASSHILTPPAKRIRSSTSLTDPLPMMGQYDIPTIVHTGPAPDEERESTAPHSFVTAALEARRPQSENGTPHAASPSGSLTSVLSGFAQLLEGRQQVARGLEVLARDGQHLLDGGSTTVATGPAYASVNTVDGGNEDGQESPSAGSVDESESGSEWTESSVGDDTTGAAAVATTILPSNVNSSRSAQQASITTEERANEQQQEKGPGQTEGLGLPLVDSSAATLKGPASTSRSIATDMGPSTLDFDLQTSFLPHHRRRSRSPSPPTSKARPSLLPRASSSAHFALISQPLHTAEPHPSTTGSSVNTSQGQGSSSVSHCASTPAEQRKGKSPIVSGWCAWRVESRRPRKRAKHAADEDGDRQDVSGSQMAAASSSPSVEEKVAERK
ncbi:unnamed protein product [Tilletia controversa]|uniref:Uncharacterized protein n=3 Tax=Tilletia TaxID=13289 RepID=A0A8X7ST54_9BASI|nr:hypothetical protein CF328_g7242 [Tilletia controversa]KAE8190963.1 hypothetical protein CF336_g5074 [Tilletia laevis]KAE8258191.1 hypothetical protein A4X03_0g4453 [Tilletia caries]KAE8198203.1 hypothetical protein CF335_g4434 [Tilletia laevis]KAE8239785.1 hypothetical protein A4X06_0g8047 [Tilletia controversa]